MFAYRRRSDGPVPGADVHEHSVVPLCLAQIRLSGVWHRCPRVGTLVSPRSVGDQGIPPVNELDVQFGVESTGPVLFKERCECVQRGHRILSIGEVSNKQEPDRWSPPPLNVRPR